TIGLRNPAWTFPVLVMPYAVAALAIYTEASPVFFGYAAIAFVVVLATSVRNRALANLPPGTTRRGWRTGVTRAAAASGALALFLTGVAAIPIPERSANAANAGGTGAVQLGDPSLDLIRNVTSTSDQPVLTYTTSDEAGEYLRLAALAAFDNRGFHLTATDLVPFPLNAGPAPVETKRIRTSVQIADLASEYLPMPWIPAGAEVPANWRYDPRTMAVVAVGDDRRSATRRLEYTVTSERLPAVEDFLPGVAEAGRPADGGVTLALPDEVSPAVRELAEQVTAGDVTAGQKALSLRDFLRSGAFTYSTVVSPGSTLQTLDDFLLGSRVGYCEQFAGGLAVMARMLGIPSRVVVGFLPGKKVDGRWEVNARNMHAWTEVYFDDGVGWVPLDPTPGSAVGITQPSSSTSARTVEPSIRPSSASATAVPTVAPVTPAGQTGQGSAAALLVVAGGLAGAALVAFGPRLARRLVRWRRLAVRADPRVAVEYAWAEVQAVFVDQGEDWPAGSSRQVLAALGPELDGRARAELAALALLVERARYSGEPVTGTGLAERVAVVTRGMKKRWAAPTAWLRRWWPQSLWPQRPSS
ncbi:MAG: transglutaminase domain-containing protein, partial [Propionibacteriaceae bacterium]|nr:transglutaminase domain-containing protein [Propionibacteriaceae bacterium]